MSNLYLIHSGVNGMEWYKRNGPPYPLTASQHSLSEKRAGTSGWTKEAKKEAKNSDAKIYDVEFKQDREAREKEEAAQAKRTTDAVKNIGKSSNDFTKHTSDTAKKIQNVKEKTHRKTEDYSSLSDSELQQRINRMSMEQRYSELSSNQTKKGKVEVTDIIDIGGSVLAAGVSAATIAVLIYQLRHPSK